MPLTEWASNIIPVMKKQGPIRVCVYYKDLNKVCPKENYFIPFIDKIINNYAISVMFSFTGGFSSYNQIAILPSYQNKTTFIFPWVTFSYRKMPFGHKNVGATF